MPKTGYEPVPALSDMRQRFALALAEGLGPTTAAKVAGMAQPNVVGSQLARDPRVRAVVRAYRERRLDKLASLSLRVLEDLVRSKSISPAVRFNAVKLSLALAGHRENGSTDEDDNPLSKKRISEMSVDELDAFIAKERERRANAAKPVIDQRTGQGDAKPLKDNEKTEPLQGSAPALEGEATQADGLAGRRRTGLEPIHPLGGPSPDRAQSGPSGLDKV